MLKNYLNTHYRRFSFMAKTGMVNLGYVVSVHCLAVSPLRLAKKGGT